jgi:hydroxylysine kinase
VTGIIDFGDMVETPLIVDLATASAYQIVPDEDPLQVLGEFVAGYHAASPIEPEEFSVLFDLVKARLVTTLVITAWRASLYPENRTYIMRNAGQAWTALGLLENVGRERARAHLMRACNVR